MKTIAYAAAILMFSATACLAQANNMAGSVPGAADQQHGAAIQSNEPSNPQAMSSQNTFGQTKTDAAQPVTPQAAQMPSGCTPSDQTCGNGRNPSVQSPTEKREQPASPQ